MTSDLYLRLGEVMVHVLDSILGTNLALLKDRNLLLPHLHKDEQLCLPLLELLLSSVHKPSRGLNLMLQLLDVSKVKAQTPCTARAL